MINKLTINLLDRAGVKLLQEERFWGHLYLKLKRVYTTDIPTMAINIQDGVTLMLNPYFFNDHTLESQVAFIKHELKHLAWDHLSRRKLINPKMGESTENLKDLSIKDMLKLMQQATEFNIAEDVAINQMISDIPKTVRIFDKNGEPLKDEKGKDLLAEPYTLETLQKQLPEVKIKPNQSMEYYYDILVKNKINNKNKQNQILITLDNHDIKNKSNSAGELSDELKNEIVKKLLKDTVNEVGAGNVPGELKELISSLYGTTKNWESIVGKFVSDCTTTETQRTRRKKNRRYGWKFPGIKYNLKSLVVVAIDTSGSVNDKALVKFMAEIDAINQLGIEVIVIQCDTKVNSVNRFDPQEKIHIHGRGGTLFKPVFDLVVTENFINEYGNVDGLIYFTDGDNFDTVIEPDFPVLWTLMPNCNSNYSWGDKTWITVDD